MTPRYESFELIDMVPNLFLVEGNKLAFAGSIFWAAPEVMTGDKHTQMSDVYSFGIVLWEIITRAKLYEGVIIKYT